MTENKQKAIAVTSRDLYCKLVEMGVKLPENCANIIIEARVAGVVEIYYHCFADGETVDAASAIMFAVDSELADPARTTTEKAERMFAAYWRTTTCSAGDGWRDAWEMLPEEQKGGWIQAVTA